MDAAITTRTVLGFHSQVFEPDSQSDLGQTSKTGRRRRPIPAAQPGPSRWSVSRMEAAVLRWLCDTILVGLAYAAVAHGPSHDALYDVHDMAERRRRPRSGGDPIDRSDQTPNRLAGFGRPSEEKEG